jgi:hypothetical protein
MDKKPITHKIYMKSSWWKKVSKSLLDDPDVVCAICKRKRWSTWKKGSVKKKKKAGDKKRLLMMQCHHVKYDQMGTDKETEDIIVLCVQCHETAHIMQKKAKTTPAWDTLYKLLCKITAWKYEENVKKEYLVPVDFVEPKERKKKVK